MELWNNQKGNKMNKLLLVLLLMLPSKLLAYDLDYERQQDKIDQQIQHNRDIQQLNLNLYGESVRHREETEHQLKRRIDALEYELDQLDD